MARVLYIWLIPPLTLNFAACFRSKNILFPVMDKIASLVENPSPAISYRMIFMIPQESALIYGSQYNAYQQKDLYAENSRKPGPG